MYNDRKNNRIKLIKTMISLILIFNLIAAMLPVRVYGASEKNKIKTYVFFGSDSRKNDDSWRSYNGGKITADKSGTAGVPRSDVIMLLKVDDKKKTIDILSIYRDTMLDVSGKGKDFQKINMAYSNLGPKKAVKTIEKNLNIKIDGYVATNFKGVANVIDSLGGVSVTVENEKIEKAHRKKGRRTVADTMNEYIDEMNRLYKTNIRHVKKPGKQTLTGLQAVAYARVRYTSGGDFKRASRQRAVLSAMSSKYRSSSAITKANALVTVMENIDTNISPTTFKTLFKKTAKYKIKKKSGFPYYKREYILKTKKEKGGKSAVVVPCTLNDNVVKLHRSFYGKKKYRLSKTVKTYSKKIQKKTDYSYKKRVMALDNI